MRGDAQAVGERLEVLKARTGGSLTPELLLREGRRESSPLHPCFTWDDAVAGNKYRLWEARHLFRSLEIEVTVIKPKDGTEKSLGFQKVHLNVRGGDVDEPVYVDVRTASPKCREALLAQALREAQSWRERYRQLKELSEVFDALDGLLGK